MSDVYTKELRAKVEELTEKARVEENNLTKEKRAKMKERADRYAFSPRNEGDEVRYANRAIEDVWKLLKEVDRLEKELEQEKEKNRQMVKGFKKGEKPVCMCGKEMVVIEYKGYYDSFKFWGFAKDCKCTKNIRVREYEADEKMKGAYT